MARWLLPGRARPPSCSTGSARAPCMCAAGRREELRPGDPTCPSQRHASLPVHGRRRLITGQGRLAGGVAPRKRGALLNLRRSDGRGGTKAWRLGNRTGDLREATQSAWLCRHLCRQRARGKALVRAAFKPCILAHELEGGVPMWRPAWPVGSIPNASQRSLSAGIVHHTPRQPPVS